MPPPPPPPQGLVGTLRSSHSDIIQSLAGLFLWGGGGQNGLRTGSKHLSEHLTWSEENSERKSSLTIFGHGWSKNDYNEFASHSDHQKCKKNFGNLLCLPLG